MTKEAYLYSLLEPQALHIVVVVVIVIHVFILKLCFPRQIRDYCQQDYFVNNFD